MKYYYVYIVRCSDDSLYIGITYSLEKRINEHNQGLDQKSYTHDRRPVKLVYHEEFTNVIQAIAREKQLKGWSRAKKEMLIKENSEKLVTESKRKQRRDKLKSFEK